MKEFYQPVASFSFNFPHPFPFSGSRSEVLYLSRRQINRKKRDTLGDKTYSSTNNDQRRSVGNEIPTVLRVNVYVPLAAAIPLTTKKRAISSVTVYVRALSSPSRRQY